MSDEARPTDRVSSDLAGILNAMSPAEREELSALLRQPNTYLAEDITDLVAILQGLSK